MEAQAVCDCPLIKYFAELCSSSSTVKTSTGRYSTIEEEAKKQVEA